MKGRSEFLVRNNSVAIRKQHCFVIIQVEFISNAHEPVKETWVRVVFLVLLTIMLVNLYQFTIATFKNNKFVKLVMQIPENNY